MRDQILAEAYAAGQRPRTPEDRRPVTTGDAAKRLGLSRQGLHKLVSQHKVACEHARNGQLLFRQAELTRVLIERSAALARTRAEVLATARPRMIAGAYEPRQMGLFGRASDAPLNPLGRATREPYQLRLWPQLQLVPKAGDGERVVDSRQPKAARTFGKFARSEKGSFVNRNAGGAR